MKAHIPFVYTAKDCDIAARYFADSELFRVALDTYPAIKKHLPDNDLWVDPAIDGTVLRKPAKRYKEHLARFPGFDEFRDETFRLAPDKGVARQFVFAVLDACKELNPKCISVPQLPQADDKSRNKVNRYLAKAASEWQAKSKFSGHFILPLILTNQRQINKRTDRTAKLAATESCLRHSGAVVVWVVDSSLTDDSGSDTLQKTRLPALVDLHVELQSRLGDTHVVAGPYWAMNVVLWARGLAAAPAIGVGGGYQYYLPGGVKRAKGTDRIAIPSLKRRVQKDPSLRQWLSACLSAIPQTEPSHREFASLLAMYDQLAEIGARRQLASSYKSWFDALDSIPDRGRALALYQDFSAAFVLGRTLPGLPAIEKTARRPEKPAQQFMHHCL